jgi:CheY-like chemotaxis protein
MGKKILLADDSITIQKVIELTFSDEDFEVVTVGNGRLAIERVQDVRPDIVLCDIIMPEKDGYEVCDFVKKHPALAHIPVLLLTGAFEPFDQERAVRVGSDGFLAKPFEPQTLIAKVKELLNQAASRAAATARPAAVAPAAVPAAPPPVVVAPAPAAPVAVAAAPVPVPPAPVYTPVPLPPLVVPMPSPPAAPPAATWSVASPVLEPDPEPMTELEPEPPSAPSWNRPRPPMPAPPMLTPELAGGNFISDEPYAFVSPATPVPPSLSAYESEPTYDPEAFEPIPPEPPSAPALDEDLYVPEPLTPMEELMEVAPEEAASLSSEPIVSAPVAPPAGGWVEQTVEVSLADRALAGAAAHVEATEAERFEEVFDADANPPMPAAAREDVVARDVFSRFEPEFGENKVVTPGPPMAPAFEPEFEDSSSTVVFRGAQFEAPFAPAAPPTAVPHSPAPAEEDEMPAEPPSLNTILSSVMDPARLIPPARAPRPEPEPEPVWQQDVPAASVALPELEEEVSFSEVSAPVPAAASVPTPHSAAAEVPVPVDMVSQIAQRVLAQISDKVVREIAWEVIPDLAEALIKKEIERLKSELEKV